MDFCLRGNDTAAVNFGSHAWSGRNTGLSACFGVIRAEAGRHAFQIKNFRL
jgi:hypothetical protein